MRNSRISIYRKIIAVISLGIISLLTSTAFSQTTVKLWPNGVPGSINCAGYTERINPSQVDRVTDPELMVYLPVDKSTNGTGILICPGGAYSVLAWEHEGISIARWLNEQGIAAFVLKYRLPSGKIMKDKSVGPLQDAQQAMRLIRSNAEKWHINTSKIGVMGFSAGGHLAATLSTLYKEKLYNTDTVSARPDFTILVYPLVSFDAAITHHDSKLNLLGTDPDAATVLHYSADKQITFETPPAFIVHATDDDCVPVKHSLLYYEALQKHKVPVEMHIYQKGGHGFGLKSTGAIAEWGKACLLWMNENGW
jgi:acetyl esterase/lipase